MNKRGRNTPTESKLLLLVYSAGSLPLAGKASLSGSVTGADARLCGWSEVARSRRRALSVGCRNGDSPLRSPAPSPPLSLSLKCKCTSISSDLSVVVLSLFLFPLPLSLAPSLFLSIFVSLALSFPTARPYFISPPLSFLLSVFFFSPPCEIWKVSFGFINKERSSLVVGIAGNKLCALGRKNNTRLFILCACFGHSIHTSYTIFYFSFFLFLLFLQTYLRFVSIPLLEVSANWSTYAQAPMAPILPSSLSPTHPPLVSSPICGGNYMPPSHPSAATHTQQNRTYPPSAPASLLFLTVPQCPLPPGAAAPCKVPVRADLCRLPPSICSPLWWHPRYLFYDRGLNFPISHMPHNCFLLIYWSVLFTTHQGAVTRQ